MLSNMVVNTFVQHDPGPSTAMFQLERVQLSRAPYCTGRDVEDERVAELSFWPRHST